VRAVDADLPRPLAYSFGPGMKELASVFTIDAETGWVSLLSRLDRERISEYNLTLMVTDRDEETRINGRMVTLTATTSLIITVTDCNDNAPRFSKADFSTAVNEGALPGIIVFFFTFGVNFDITTL
jgi:protocadherin Fat 1/2/3